MADIFPSSISSAEAWGTPTVVGYTDFTGQGIASAEVWGSLVVTQNIDFHNRGIASEEAWGRAAIVGSATGIPRYTVFINGVDRSTYVRLPSIRRSMQIGGGSRANCEFETADKTKAGYRPAVDDSIVIFRYAEMFFSGAVETTEERWFKGTSNVNQVRVRCTDWGTLLDRRVIGKFYTLYLGGIASITIADLVRNFLSDIISYDWEGTDGLVVLGEQMFNYCTAAEALNQICDKTGQDWYVDFWQVLRCFSKTVGTGAAPWTISDNDGNFDDIAISRTRSRRINRQGVRNSQMGLALWEDSVTAFAGQTSFLTTYPQDVEPIVTVNGVEKTIVDISRIGEEASDFYFITNGTGIFHRLGGLNVGDEVVVLYPSKLAPVFWAEDSADVALHGAYEAVEEAKDLMSAAACDSMAAGLLVRASVEPVSVTLVSRQSGWEPGQVLSMNMQKPPFVGNLLIESVDSEETVERGQPVFRHTIRATNSTLARANRADNFFARLILRDKQPLDRITYHIGFTLAETVEGLDNPGLTVGAKQAIRIADKGGVLRDCTLHFKSVVDGTLTTAPVVIDVFKNGESIFPTGNANKMVFQVGATSRAQRFKFAVTPMPVVKGDVFTLEVLEADSAAKDGTLELVVLG